VLLVTLEVKILDLSTFFGVWGGDCGGEGDWNVIVFLECLGLFKGVLGVFLMVLMVLGRGGEGEGEGEEEEYWLASESISEIIRGSSSLPFTLFFTFSGLDDCFFGICYFEKYYLIFSRLMELVSIRKYILSFYKIPVNFNSIKI
jgi:hypothetical protein